MLYMHAVQMYIELVAGACHAPPAASAVIRYSIAPTDINNNSISISSIIRISIVIIIIIIVIMFDMCIIVIIVIIVISQAPAIAV